MEGEEGGGAMAQERRGLRGGGESQADAPRMPRPRSGPSPLPCPEASTAVGAGGGGELGRARGRPWDSTSRRFGGRWVARARTDARERGRACARVLHAPARSRRAAGTTQSGGRGAESHPPPSVYGAFLGARAAIRCPAGTATR